MQSINLFQIQKYRTDHLIKCQLTLKTYLIEKIFVFSKTQQLMPIFQCCNFVNLNTKLRLMNHSAKINSLWFPTHERFYVILISFRTFFLFSFYFIFLLPSLQKFSSILHSVSMLLKYLFFISLIYYNLAEGRIKLS